MERTHPDATRGDAGVRLSVEGNAFFFDFDGTLVEIADVPGAVSAPPGLIGDLGALVRASEGALAILTGRTLAALDAFLTPLRLPAAGVHGLETRHASNRDPIGASPAGLLPPVALSAMRALAAADPRLLVEDKGASAAIHFRQAPERAADIVASTRAIAAAFGETLVCQPGRMVIELRLVGPDKGDALRAFMASPPFAGRTPAVFGDDVTDESAFAAARALGGLAIRVGFAPRAELADADLAGAAEVRRTIAALARSGTVTLPGRRDGLPG
jgi:trehalose 6-phosphate phosphatase